MSEHKKYSATCDHCGKETRIGFEEWNNLKELMLDFIRLTKEQKDIILLMIDGAFYREQQTREARKRWEEENE